MGLLSGFLEFLRFVEFWMTPLGIVGSLWLSLYYFLLQVLGLNLLLAVLLPMIPSIDLYFLLKRLDY